jgi:CheY-like chemotaxis protein
MHSDLTRVRQILLNLLSNAAKFTSNGVIRLQVEDAGDAGAGLLRFSVSDTGVGMTPAQMERVFEAFAQADASVTRKYGGTGLGLAITRRFCEMLGGSITLDSVPEKGSTFTVNLPRRSQEAAARPSPEATAAAGGNPGTSTGGPAVLVIDDDPAVHDLLKRSLERDSFAAISAYTGEQGIELARTSRPLAIILDVLMPGMDGWTVLSLLKADPLTRDIPVIIASVLHEEHMAVSLGASDYATKPVDRDRLMGMLSRYCSASGSGTILVVDDDASAREIIRRGVSRDGWTVIEADNGAEALAAMESRRPDVILLDLLMPTMDGFEFLRELRSRETAGRHIPVIVVTAKDLSEAERRSLSQSVKNVMRKATASSAEIVSEVRAAARSVKQGA